MSAELLHILVVDDHHSVREGLRFVLELDGYRVSAAADGREALEVIARDRPDLVLTDLQMPVMDGPELRRRLAGLAPDLPVVFMSVRDAGAEARTHAAAGALNKPFEAADLLDLLARLLPARGPQAA